ncbi:MAG TPA: ATP-binding protein, partial [Geobacteraceae bacterium]
DLRIATNVPTSDGGRAIGTRMSTEVYNRLILNREKWLGRAFVVSDWYFTAYEPILSLDNVPIGALYVGMKEQHFTATKLSMGVLYSFVLLVGTLFGLGVSWLAGSRMARPVKELEKAVRLVSAGERDVQIRVASRDELGSLASEFNLMARTLKEREASIIELNQGLEEKVRVRTVELEENNRLLLQTREELVRAEKLAAVGELAAGVAHEINNPLAIIRGNAELLQMSVSQEADNREEVDTIYQQVARMERIVANLLSFARQQRTVVGRVQLAAMLHDIVSQIGHQTPLTGITVREQYSPELTEIEGDEGQLRQVVTNLILNAIQAMPGGGTLTITTAGDPVSDSCLISICDTGAGIPADNLTQVFNPFFTTKAGGTGLGLSVSYGIVREHGGSIAVTSGTGGGTTFSVTLPIRQSAAGDPA